MCLAIPAQVTELADEESHQAKVDVAGARRVVNTLLLEEPVAPGDWVLVHVGFAMAKIDEAEALLTLRALQSIGSALAEEIDAIDEPSTT